MSDIEYTYTQGKGPGGQHRNRHYTCVTAIHKPTGISCRVDGRNQKANKREATRLLRLAISKHYEAIEAEEKKKRRDEKIKDNTRVRTYDYTKGIVIDHRTGKTAPIKDVLVKGKLDKLK